MRGLKHSATSLHYAGAAVDLRTKDMGGAEAKRAHKMLQEALPEDFDVILEGNHIHMEWQPRYRG